MMGRPVLDPLTGLPIFGMRVRISRGSTVGGLICSDLNIAPLVAGMARRDTPASAARVARESQAYRLAFKAFNGAADRDFRIVEGVEG